jgi:hypothetical protein
MARRARRPLGPVRAFWDSSALVPLCVGQSLTPGAVGLYRTYEVVVWWATPVEIASALARLLGMGASSCAFRSTLSKAPVSCCASNIPRTILFARYKIARGYKHEIFTGYPVQRHSDLLGSAVALPCIRVASGLARILPESSVFQAEQCLESFR